MSSDDVPQDSEPSQPQDARGGEPERPQDPQGGEVGRPQDPPGGEAERPQDPALAIGGRLAEHRTRRGVKVSALARQIGVSPSLISQIERGQSRPSVSTLFALAEALEVPVDAFFRNGEAAPPAARPAARAGEGPRGRHRYVVRKADRAGIDIEGGVRWERLTPMPLDDVEFMELIYQPGSESNASLYRHPGFEIVLVLSGELVIHVGFERYELGPGDSMAFPSTQPHRYVNDGDVTVHAITAILPDGLSASDVAGDQAFKRA